MSTRDVVLCGVSNDKLAAAGALLYADDVVRGSMPRRNGRFSDIAFLRAVAGAPRWHP